MLERLHWACALSLVASAAGTTYGQQVVVRGHVYLPRTQGATVLSTYIDAEARRMVAFGDLLEAAAIARRIHVDSDREAMKNSLLWVETYFERKKLNQQYRRELNPSYSEKQQRRDESKRQLIVERPAEALNGDVTDELNWLLDRLVTDQSIHQIVSSDAREEVEEVDRPLNPEQISHIRLRQATGQEGGGQSFRADAAKLLHPQWPRVFSDSQFARERNNFESARDRLLDELKTGRPTFATWRGVQESHDDLRNRFEEVYTPQSLRGFTGNQRVLIRREGQDFLKNLAASISIAFTADNEDIFAGQYRFSGDSLIDLVRHCADCGIEFAPPQTDDKPTYRTLFVGLRQVYLRFNPTHVE